MKKLGEYQIDNKYKPPNIREMTDETIQEITAEEIRQLFRNKSDCYADTWQFDKDGNPLEGKVTQAMTEVRFVEVVQAFVYLKVAEATKQRDELLWANNNLKNMLSEIELAYAELGQFIPKITKAEER